MASPTSGTKPLAVQFTDTSTNTPTNFFWLFGDGTNTTSRNPSHRYFNARTYTVNHSAKNSIGTVWNNKTAFITVSAGPTANFTGTPTSGTAPLTVAFTDRSTGSPTSWLWAFGDGGTATIRNSSHMYASPGTYTVSMRVENADGNDTMVRAGYVGVTAPVARMYSITMICDYYGDGNNDSLCGAGPTIAQYVDSDLKNDGWQTAFLNTNSSVTKEDFGTSQSGWQGLDEATFHYHFGHGSKNISQPWPLIPDSGLYLYHWFDMNDYLSPSDVSGKWDKNNKWVVFDACEALGDSAWGDALVTSHGILGFSSEKLAKPLLSKRFFQNTFGSENQTIYLGWRTATQNQFDSDTIAAVRFDNQYQMEHDHMPGHGEVAPDEYPNDGETIYEEWSC